MLRTYTSIICIMALSFISAMAQCTLSIPDVTIAPGKTISLPVYMDNAIGVVGIQFTLTLPESIELKTQTAALTDRANSHDVTLQKKNGTANDYLAIIYSTENKVIAGRTGVLLTVNVTSSSTIEEETILPMALSNVILADKDGRNIVTDYKAGDIRIAKSPDLEVTNVVSSQSSVAPNSNLSISWTVSNIGGLPTTGGWKEQIFIEGTDGVSKILGTLYYDGSMNTGGSVTRNAELVLPMPIGVDGNSKVKVKIVPSHDNGEPSWLLENNTAETATNISVGKILTVSPNVIKIDEKNDNNIRFQLTRSGSTLKDEEFVISKTQDDRIVLPESIKISRGQSSTYFYAQVMANKLLDDEASVYIQITGNGYDDAIIQLAIEDDTYPDLTLTAKNLDITEGDNTTFTISTERASTKDIEVKLTCDYAERFNIPTKIVIPKGKTSVDVNIEAKEDNIPNIEEVVTFVASAAMHNSSTLNTILLDNDIPTLVMNITPNAVSEGAGPLAMTANIRRTDKLDKRITVKLSDDSNGEIYYSKPTFEMAPGIEEINVNIGPIDNTTVDGERTHNVSAAVWIASCSCNANNGTLGSKVSIPVTIYDNDGPTLTMTASASVLKEGDEIEVTIRRNTTTNKAVTINLICDHDADIIFPSTVIIPSGKSETTFSIKSKRNSTTSDGFMATLSAMADGFATCNTCFIVNDQTLPDAQIVNMSVSTNEVEAGGSITIETKISNVGSYDLPELTKVGIYTTNSSAAIATMYLQQNLAAGDSIVLKRTIKMPTSVGIFDVYAIVNEDKGVKELCYTNNSSKVFSVKTISPYSVYLKSDKSVYKPGEKVLFTGHITGTDVSEKDIEIYIINNNYRHTLSVKTDTKGTFSIEYEPYKGQTGHFIAGACYPKENLRTDMVIFDYYGVKRVSNDYITCEAVLGETYSGKYTLSNPGNLVLSNVKVEIVSKPENCKVSVTCPKTIKPNSTFDVEYKIDATAASEGNEWQNIELKLISAEGASLPTILYYYCRNRQGKLQASIASINTTMIKDSSRDYPFIITNTGKGETGRITLEIPSWMSLVTPREIASLAQGDSAIVILRLTPTKDMQLNVPVTGSIDINCSNSQGITLPYSIEPVSDSMGTLVIDVCDENTYYTTDKPHLAGAEVSITHPITGEVLATGTTDKNGIYSIQLHEGLYNVSVSAIKHKSYHDVFLVNPGVNNVNVVNISIEAIKVEWMVEETEITDTYTVVAHTTFETNVPKPVIIMSGPKSIDYENMREGESQIFFITLTNKGLVNAYNNQILLPKQNEEWSMTLLDYMDPFIVEPMSSIEIPVLFTKLPHDANSRKGAQKRALERYQTCMAGLEDWYEDMCGTSLDRNSAAMSMAIKTCLTSELMSVFEAPFHTGALTNPNSISYSGGGSSVNYSAVFGRRPYICNPEIADHANNLLNGLTGALAGQIGGPVGALAGAVADAANNAMSAASDIASSGSISPGTIGSIGWGAVSPFIGAMAPAPAGDAIVNGVNAGLMLGDAIGMATAAANSKPRKTLLHIKEADSINLQDYEKNVSNFDWINHFFTYASMMSNYIDTYFNLLEEIFGEPCWYMDTDESSIIFYSKLKEFGNSDFTTEKLIPYKPNNVTIHQLNRLVERTRNSNPDNSIDATKIHDYLKTIDSFDHFAIKDGYENFSLYFYQELRNYESQINESSNTMCASISLEFSQNMVMTRQAFRGTLTVFNGHDTTAMKDVKLSLTVKDNAGNIATSHEFQINLETLKGFNGQLNLEDGWTLDSQKTGVATIMFIPTKYAATMIEEVYYFGGSLSYVDPFTNSTITRDLFPVTLTVKPSPNLDLTYFMQRDIKGDDPLTEEIESSEEAEFSLLINNIGYGDATEVKMFTEQPKIVDNEKGLLIDFELISSQLNGSDKTLALGGTIATDFGTIPAKSTSYAQWWMKSSLLGHFTDYNIKATHVTSYDNADLSLLNDITIHELIRSLEVEVKGKKLVGFMTNDITDAEDMPDMLYLSNGNIESVAVIRAAEIKELSSEEYSLILYPGQIGWNYGNIADPTLGSLNLVSITRKSDGASIPIRNFWQTDCTLRDGKDPLYENNIHFADYIASNNTEEYLLKFEALPEILLEVSEIKGVPEMGTLINKPVQTLTVVFNKDIVSESFTTDDIEMTIQGVVQNIELLDIKQIDSKSFEIDFSRLNMVSPNGYHEFTINTKNIIDTNGYTGKYGKSTSWVLFDPTNKIEDIKEPKSDDTLIRIYTVAGSPIFNVPDSKKNLGLPKGVYIINGRKHIVN